MTLKEHPIQGILMKPKVFVGSSSESIEYAYALQSQLGSKADVVVWNQGIFEINRSFFETLTRTIGEVDFGIFVFAPDDVTRIRDRTSRTVRDNVLFEFGLFLGALGKDRTFFIAPRERSELELPTDLLGVSSVSYDAEADNIEASLGPACFRIMQAIGRLGIRQERLGVPAVETSANPRILCACSPAFFNFSFEEDVRIIRKETENISGRIVEAHGIGSTEMKAALIENDFDIIHMAAHVNPRTGDISFCTPPLCRSPRPEDDDVLPADGFAKLVERSKARLVILATCDSLILAAKLAKVTNMVAASDWVTVRDLVDWEVSFYKCLARGASVSSAYEMAKSTSHAPMLLLLKKDVAFTN